MTAQSSHTSAVHGTISLERNYSVPASRVYAAFAIPEIRRQWNSPAEGVEVRIDKNDFRTGGSTVEICVAEGQDIARVETSYLDIVENRRLLFSEAISDPERFLGASLVTVEFQGADAGTRLVIVIQTCGVDGSGLENEVVVGWRSALDRLERVLAG
jgi:uncharacterized protein YndB with AHSA1/START domain